MAYTFATAVFATSAATDAMLLPITAASTVQPVCLASACAPARVSKETRFSLPSRCSAITRIVSAISSVLDSRLALTLNFIV